MVSGGDDRDAGREFEREVSVTVHTRSTTLNYFSPGIPTKILTHGTILTSEQLTALLLASFSMQITRNLRTKHTFIASNDDAAFRVSGLKQRSITQVRTGSASPL